MNYRSILLVLALFVTIFPAIAQTGDPYTRALSEGNRFASTGEWSSALARYSDALDHRVTFEALMCRGLAYYHLGEFRLALNDFNRAVSLDGGNAAGFNNRGTVFQALDLPDQALADFNRALTLKPDYGEALYNRGHLFRLSGRFAEAQADLDRLLELAPKAWLGYYERGLVYMAQGLAPLALADFSRSQTLNEGFPDVYLARGQIRIMLEQYTQAIEDLNRYLKFTPDSAEGLIYRAIAWNFGGYPDRALEDYNRALESHPEEPLLYLGRGELHFSLGHYSEAAEDFRAVERLRPDWPGITERLDAAERNL